MRDIRKTAKKLRLKIKKLEGDSSCFAGPIPTLKTILSSLTTDKDLFKVTPEGARIYRGSGYWEPVTEESIAFLAGALDGTIKEYVTRPKAETEEPKFIRVDSRFRRELTEALLLDIDGHDPDFFEHSPYRGAATFRDGVFAVPQNPDNADYFEHCPTFRSRSYFDFDVLSFVDKPKAPIFEMVVKDWFANEGENETARIRQVLLEFLGLAALSLASTHQKALFLLGGGNNGKSVFLNALTGIPGKFEGIFPHEYTASSSPTAWDSPGLIGMQSKQALSGMMLNAVAEVSGRFNDTASFKSIIVGDRVFAREAHSKMGQKNFSCAHIFGLNSLIDSHKDDSDGFFRRCLFVPFSRDFAKSPTSRRWDPMQLSMEIAKERGPIMAMALEAAVEVLKRGHYTETLSSARLLRGYRETNPFFEFCSGLDRAATSNSKKDWMTLGTLWAEFNRLQYNSGYTGSDAIKKGKFLEKMKDAFPEHHAYYGRRWVFCLNFLLEEDVPRIGIVSAQRAEEFEET